MYSGDIEHICDYFWTLDVFAAINYYYKAEAPSLINREVTRWVKS